MKVFLQLCSSLVFITPLLESSEACGGTLYGDTGTITSPDHPASYPHNLNCIWTVNGTRDSHITIHFTNFDIVCPGDTLTIYDGEMSDNKTLLYERCGIHVHDEIGVVNTTTNLVYIKFITDSNSRSTGFSLTWNGIKTENTASTLRTTEYTDSTSVKTINIDSSVVTTAHTESTPVACTSAQGTTMLSPTTDIATALVIGSTLGGLLAGIIIGITVTSLFCLRRFKSLNSMKSKEDEAEMKRNRAEVLPMSDVASSMMTGNNTETYESLVNEDNTVSSDQYTSLNINHIAVATQPTAGNSKGIYEPLVDAGNTTSSDQYTPLDLKDKTSEANIGGSFAYANEMMSTVSPRNDMVSSDMVTV